MKTILLIDDQANVRRFLGDFLRQEGYHVVEAESGRQALLLAQQEPPDLILLDIMMPGMDGFTFLRTYRQGGTAQILILSAKQDEADIVLGLELGADDFMIKSPRMRELLARVRVLLRRGEAPTQTNAMVRAADIVVDRQLHRVTVADRVITMTPSEFALLDLLISAPGRVFTRQHILNYLGDGASENVERTINVHIYNLRQKIEPDPSSPRYIETVFGIGYRFRPDESEVA